MASSLRYTHAQMVHSDMAVDKILCTHGCLMGIVLVFYYPAQYALFQLFGMYSSIHSGFEQLSGNASGCIIISAFTFIFHGYRFVWFVVCTHCFRECIPQGRRSSYEWMILCTINSLLAVNGHSMLNYMATNSPWTI